MTNFPDTNNNATAPDPNTGWVAGDQFTTDEGVVYTWTGYSWTTEGSGGGGGGDYLPLTGGDLTGPLTSTSNITLAGQVESTGAGFGFTSNATSFPFTSESTLGNGGKAYYAKHTSSGGASSWLFYGENNTGEVFSVTTDGSITAAGSITSGVTGTGVSIYSDGTIQSWNNGNLNFNVAADGNITAADRIIMGSSTNRGQFKGICPAAFTPSATGFLDAQYNGTSVIEMKYDGSAEFKGPVISGENNIRLDQSVDVFRAGNSVSTPIFNALSGASYANRTSVASINADGSITAAGPIDGSSYIASDRGSGNLPCLVARQSGEDNAVIYNNGNATFNGSITAKDRLMAGSNDFGVTAVTNEAGLFYNNSTGQYATVNARNMGGGAVFRGFNAAGTTTTDIDAEGNAEFKGKVKANSFDLESLTELT